MRFKYNAYYRDTHCTDSNRKNDDMRKCLYIFRDHSTLINGVHTKYSRIRAQRYFCGEQLFKIEGTHCIRKCTVGYVKGLDAKQLFSYVLTTDILVRKLFMGFEWGWFLWK